MYNSIQNINQIISKRRQRGTWSRITKQQVWQINWMYNSCSKNAACERELRISQRSWLEVGLAGNGTARYTACQGEPLQLAAAGACGGRQYQPVQKDTRIHGRQIRIRRVKELGRSLYSSKSGFLRVWQKMAHFLSLENECLIGWTIHLLHWGISRDGCSYLNELLVLLTVESPAFPRNPGLRGFCS